MRAGTAPPTVRYRVGVMSPPAAVPSDSSSLQREARALGDPTRYAIFRNIADSSVVVDVARLTAHFGLNHNAIRQHLAKLVHAGLVVETTARDGAPGRPRHLYAPAPSVESRWGVVGPYERLSLLLAEVVRTGASPVEVGRDAGRRLVEECSDDLDDLERLTGIMGRQGFEPELHKGKGAAEVVLHHCPFSNVARTDPDTVCSLHLGMAESMVAGTGYVVDDLVRKDPSRAGCRVRLHKERS